MSHSEVFQMIPRCRRWFFFNFFYFIFFFGDLLGDAVVVVVVVAWCLPTDRVRRVSRVSFVDPPAVYRFLFCFYYYYYWFYRVCLSESWSRVFIGFRRFSFLTLTGFYWTLAWVRLLGFTEFYLVLLSFTGFYWVLLGFNQFYWVLLGFT